MSDSIKISETDFLKYDTTERDLNLSLFQSGYESGMRDAFGKKLTAPRLPNEFCWQAGFEVGSQCALEAMRQFKETLK